MQKQDMAWLDLLEPFVRRRFNDEMMQTARAALPAILARQPAGDVNPEKVADEVMAVTASLVDRFVTNKLI